MTSAQDAASGLRLAEIAQALGGVVHGDGDRRIGRIASLESAQSDAISFVAHTRFKPQLAATQAGALVVRDDLLAAALQRCGAVIVASDPYLYYARLTQWWAARVRSQRSAGVHPSAVLGTAVQIHPTASVGPLAVIEDGAVIGPHAVIGAQCLVGGQARIGEASRLLARVTVGAACIIGARATVQSGAVIGSDGFGFAPHAGRWEKIEQLGAVVIGDDVDIGANTCIDRGALDDTVLADGVKLDNLIQIAHNVRIGAHTAMAGCVGVAGSARIGSHCTVGGAAMILGHLEIADNVHISAGSFVMSSLTKPGQYSGVFPIDDNANWEKNAATLRQLHTLRSRLRALEKKIEP